MSGNTERDFTIEPLIADARKITREESDEELHRYWKAFDKMCEDHERKDYYEVFLVRDILALEIKIRHLEREVLGVGE